MKFDRIGRRLASFMMICAFVATLMLLAFSACAQAPVVTADGNIVVPPGLPPTQQSLMVLIGLGVPLLISLAKAEIPKLPGWSLPLLAPLMGAGADYLLGLAGAHPNGWLLGALAGSAGVGAREVKDQLQGALADRIKLGPIPPAAPAVKAAAVAMVLMVGCLAFTGCVLSKKSVVTQNPDGTFTTNIVTTVNQANLAVDCAVFELGATPLLTQALVSDPAARPIVVDVRTAVDGVQNGVNTNTMAIIVGFAGKNAALDQQLGALVQKVSDLRGQLLAKWGASNAGIIEQAVAASVVRVCDASLAATAKQAWLIPSGDSKIPAYLVRAAAIN